MHDLGSGYIDWLSTTTLSAYERACAELADPPVDDVDHALRLAALLVEALEGFAYGCVMSHISVAVARWFGAPKGDAVRTRLRRFIHLRPSIHTDDAPTLREHLRRQLSCRVAHLPTRAMVEDARAHLSHSHVLALAFEAAQKDTLLAERLSHEVAVGWTHLTACLKRCPLPTVSPLWAEWQRRALRQPPGTPALVAIAPEYIMRIG